MRRSRCAHRSGRIAPRRSRIRYHEEISGSSTPSSRSAFPGFADLAESPEQLIAQLVGRRQRLGLSQTEVAARMGTSQSAVARLERGDADVRLSTLNRYAAALGHRLGWVHAEVAASPSRRSR